MNTESLQCSCVRLMFCYCEIYWWVIALMFILQIASKLQERKLSTDSTYIFWYWFQMCLSHGSLFHILCVWSRQSGINTGFDLLLTNNRCGCCIELRLENWGLFLHRPPLMERCNFQAVELTHISLCGTNLPVMNLPGHCGASTTQPGFLLLCRGGL